MPDADPELVRLMRDTVRGLAIAPSWNIPITAIKAHGPEEIVAAAMKMLRAVDEDLQEQDAAFDLLRQLAVDDRVRRILAKSAHPKGRCPKWARQGVMAVVTPPASKVSKVVRSAPRLVADKGGDIAARRLGRLRRLPLVPSMLVSRDVAACVLNPEDVADVGFPPPSDRSSPADARLADALKQRAQRLFGPATKARYLLEAATVLIDSEEFDARHRDVLFCLGGYCGRRGEAYATEQNSPDCGADYLLEGVVLQGNDTPGVRQFLTAHYLRTLASVDPRAAAELPRPGHSRETAPENYVTMLHHASQAASKNVAIGVLALAERDPDWVGDFVFRCQVHVVRSLFDRMRDFLNSPPLRGYDQATLVFLAKNFRDLRADFTDGLRAAVDNSVGGDGAGSHSDLLAHPFMNLSRGENTQSVLALSTMLRHLSELRGRDGPNERRQILASCLADLSSHLHHCDDRPTRLRVEHVIPAFETLRRIVTELDTRERARLRPTVVVQLDHETYDLSAPFDLQLSLHNPSLGTAIVTGLTLDVAESTTSKYQVEHDDLDIAVSPGHTEIVAIRISPIARDTQVLAVTATVHCRDSDGTLFTLEGLAGGIIRQLPRGIDFEAIANPFEAGMRVEDEKMFLGREDVLDQLETWAIQPRASGVAFLFGQKRVGKSSLLYFLNRRMEAGFSTHNWLPVEVDWLQFSQHRPHNVFYEIAVKTARRYRALTGTALSIPPESDFGVSYTVAFNRFLLELEEHSVSVFFMIDEFDKVITQYTNPVLQYDESFFDYLRSLSIRKGTRLLLAGGEELPELLSNFGKEFNNAKRFWVSYLDEDATRCLLRNDYLAPWLAFSDEAIHRIYNETAGNPYFAQMIGDWLVERCRSKHAVYVSVWDVDQEASIGIRSRLTEPSVQHLYQHGDKIVPGEAAVLAEISRVQARSQASWGMSESAISDHVALATGELHRCLLNLTQREVLEHVGDGDEYHIRIEMFAKWYAMNLPLPDEAWAMLKATDA